MMETKGLVFDICSGAPQDGPGVRTTVLFKGCTLACGWCPTPELQLYAPELVLHEERCVRCGKCVVNCAMQAAQEETIPGDGSRYTVDQDVCIVCGSCIVKCEGEAREQVGRWMTAAEVLEQIERDAQALKESGGGVTFAGGEPLMQSAFLEELLKACKARGIATAVDTTGYIPWEFLERIRADVDLFLYDLKLIDDTRHRALTGLPNPLILENLKALAERGQRIILHVPLVPGINDDPANLNAIAEFAAGLPALEGVDLLAYPQKVKEKYTRMGKTYRLGEVLPPNEDQMNAAAAAFERRGLPVKVIA